MVQGLREENETIPLSWLCRALGLARSSYYAGIKAKARMDGLDQKVWEKITNIWEMLPGIGYRKLAKILGYNKKKIQRILQKYRQANKAVKRARRVDVRKIPNVIKKITNDLLENPEKQLRRNWVLRTGKNAYRHIIEPLRPYQLWAGDWKELKLPLLGVTVYIFAIIDCYTRQLVGWNLSITKDSKAAVTASQSAIDSAKKDALFDPRKLIMHTDQGSAYLSEDYAVFWRSLGVVLSTADKGKPTQNPYAEAFFSILSKFWLNYQELLTVSDAKNSINHFFNIYNNQWPHGAIGNLSPNQKLYEFHTISTQRYLCPTIGS